MTTRDIPVDPGDVDPTGVQAMLRALPDPGPMPAELVARISARLEEERATHPVPALPHVVPLHPRERDRGVDRRFRPVSTRMTAGLVAAAASVALLGVVGVNTLLSRAPADRPISDSAALLDGTHRATLPTAPGGQAMPGGGRVHITQSSRAYTTAAFGRQAAAYLADDEAALHPLGAESPSIGPIGTPVGVASCLSGLGLGGRDAFVDLATYDGAPAAIVVLAEGGHLSARAVPRSCSAGAVQVLGGPVNLR